MEPMETPLEVECTHSSRRSFLGQFLVGTLASGLPGSPWRQLAAASVGLQGGAGPGLPPAAVLRLRPADYEPLQSSFGALRIGLAPAHLPAPIPPLFIIRDGSTFRALGAQCTHAGCLIPGFRATKVAVCECHGSRFAADGSVIFGPAESPLPRYPVESAADGTLLVQLTGFPAFALELHPLTTLQRLPLTFASARQVTYQVLGRSARDAPWTPVPFALGETSDAIETQVVGTGDPVTVFVPATLPGLWISVAAVPQVV